MHLYRAMLSVLVAVAIVLAPVAAAWAGSAIGIGVVEMVHMGAHAIDGEDNVAASPMEDCASMMKGSKSTDDCPCCDENKACPPQFCVAKCFQFLSLAQQARPAANLVTARLRPTARARPPDWSDRPQPPPPRT